jgi:hypothetical protein
MSTLILILAGIGLLILVAGGILFATGVHDAPEDRE